MPTTLELNVVTLGRGRIVTRDVCILQALLYARGFLTKVDGNFGPATEAAVKQFQQEYGLDPDGLVGEKTWLMLSSPVFPPPSLFAVSPATATLTDQDYEDAAQRLGTDVATVRAVCEVEAPGGGFIKDGRPKILFEGHIFWKQLKAHGIAPAQHTAGNEDILYPTWTKKHYVGGAGEYKRLSRAEKIHAASALESASWGLFQIMGFNHVTAGYLNLFEFVDAMYESEGKQLMAFCEFVRSSSCGGESLVSLLLAKNWERFARGYNGPEYKTNGYDTKLAAAYRKYA